MRTTDLSLYDYEVVAVTDDEIFAIQGGNPLVGPFIGPIIALGAIAAAGVAIYEAGKYTGEVIYHLTH